VIGLKGRAVFDDDIAQRRGLRTRSAFMVTAVAAWFIGFPAWLQRQIQSNTGEFVWPLQGKLGERTELAHQYFQYEHF
jgi:hypothetical protein